MSTALSTAAPRERPILFSASMVRAIRAGTKTQTRRIVRDQASVSDVAGGGLEPTVWWPRDGDLLLPCPYGASGDRLWVKEAHAFLDGDFRPTTMTDRGHVQVSYRADHADPVHGDGPDKLRWRPSIYMPRWASRFTLEVTDVRVERLQEITEEDARAEGVAPRVFESWTWCNRARKQTFETFVPECGDPGAELLYHDRRETLSAREGFYSLWETINGERASWASNPWVWVVSFTRMEVAL